MQYTLGRTAWVDAVKGITISLVVFHHAFVSVKNAFGLEQSLVDIYMLSTPIRMPLFFLVAGLFAQKAINSDIKTFFNTKVLYFIYFYILWNTISVVIRASLSDFTNNTIAYADALHFAWSPTFTLWFLYALLLSFLMARLLRALSFRANMLIVLVLSVLFGFVYFWQLPYFLGSFFRLYPFFILGLYQSQAIRQIVDKGTPTKTLFYLCVFSVVTYATYKSTLDIKYYVYFISALSASFFIMTSTKLLDGTWFTSLFERIGQYSLYIYLMHFLPVAAWRMVLVKAGIISNPVLLILAITMLTIPTCILGYLCIKQIPQMVFLIKKPNWLNI